MFAAAGAQSKIHIYNFFTLDCPSYYNCIGHSSNVNCIEWHEDDMGFTSCADGSVFYYNLQLQRETGQRYGEKDFN